MNAFTFTFYILLLRSLGNPSSSPLVEVQYIPSKFNINIYGSSDIIHQGKHKSVFASHHSLHLLCSDHSNSLSKAIQWNKEFEHPLPSCHDIVSVDAYNEIKDITQHQGTQIWIAAAFLMSKATPQEPHAFQLNIYGHNRSSNDSWNSIFEHGQEITLSYVPFYVKFLHSNATSSSSPYLIVSGSDHLIHTYKYKNHIKWVEVDEKQAWLPPVNKFFSSSVCFDMINLNNQSIFAYGFQNGGIHVNILNKKDRKVQSIYMTLDGPISFLKLYEDKKRRTLGSDNTAFSTIKNDIYTMNHILPDRRTDCPINLLVGGAVGYAMVFRNILLEQLNDMHLLPESDRYDSVLCGEYVYSPITKENLILIGTFGQKILAYEEKSVKKIIVRSKSDSLSEENSPVIPFIKVHKISVSMDHVEKPLEKEDIKEGIKEIIDANVEERILGIQGDQSPDVHRGKALKNKTPSPQSSSLLEKSDTIEQMNKSKSPYTLKWIHTACDPVFNIKEGEFVRDAIDYISVSTSYGQHLLQWDLGQLEKIVNERMGLLKRIMDLKAIISEQKYAKARRQETNEDHFQGYVLSNQHEPIQYEEDTIEDRFGMAVDFEDDVYMSTTPTEEME